MRLTSKLTKSANMSRKFTLYTFKMGIKNAEIDADFESVKNIANKFHPKKVIDCTIFQLNVH